MFIISNRQFLKFGRHVIEFFITVGGCDGSRRVSNLVPSAVLPPRAAELGGSTSKGEMHCAHAVVGEIASTEVLSCGEAVWNEKEPIPKSRDWRSTLGMCRGHGDRGQTKTGCRGGGVYVADLCLLEIRAIRN